MVSHLSDLNATGKGTGTHLESPASSLIDIILSITRSEWRLPFITLVLLSLAFSCRQLSDPDLGFHLQYGKYIFEQSSVPATDLTTYTVSNHTYIDLHWLFQLLIYLIFLGFGYPGLSIFFCLLSLLILLLLMKRLRTSNGWRVVCLLVALLVLEPRLLPRPEMFTFLFLLILLQILENYHLKKKGRLYLLPLLMLVWCNMHSLFILGLLATAVFFLSTWFQERRPDRKLFTWFLVSILACFLNPYHVQGFLFPFSLLTRFDQHNLFHQHIAEFRPVSGLDYSQTATLLFFLSSLLTIFFLIFPSRKRPLHEIWISLLFLVPAIAAARNQALFVLASIPFLGSQLPAFSAKSIPVMFARKSAPFLRYSLLLLMILLTVRVLNGSYYAANGSCNKTGAGINRFRLPEDAAGFLAGNRLNGRMINSLGCGGWLSWRLQQPVFIDGRLEVIGEDLYAEVFQSWNGGLNKLSGKYHAEIIVYNYQKYYPWNCQMIQNPEWRMVYLDGLHVIFLKNGYRDDIKTLTEEQVPSKFGCRDGAGDLLKRRDVHEKKASVVHSISDWMGISREDSAAVFLNAGIFCLQTGQNRAAQVLLEEALNRSYGRNTVARTALLEIHRKSKPQQPREQSPTELHGIPREAVLLYNEGNSLLEKGDLEAAIARYSAALDICPGYYKALLNRGNARANQKMFAQALNDFDAAIALVPGKGEAYLGRGSCCHCLGKSLEACSNWQAADSLGEPHAATLLRLYCR